MLRVALILIICEKIIQHILVSVAFWANTGGIRSTVAVDPTALMILGAIVALLFLAALWGVLRDHGWTPNLLIGLALFDILGECAAQGTLAIALTISFVVALLLLVLAISYRKRLREVIR